MSEKPVDAIGKVVRDLYRGDGSRLNSYDEGWNDGVEAAERAIRPVVEQAHALAIAEAARVASGEMIPANIDTHRNYDAGWNDGVESVVRAIRALSPAPSVSEEWVSRRIEDAYDKTRGNNEGDALAEDAVLATLAALGVTVEGAGK